MLKFYINDKQSHRGNRLFCWNKWIQGRIVKCLLFLSFLNTGLSDLSTALFSKTVRMSFFVKGNIQCQTAKHKFLLLKQKNCLKLNVSLTIIHLNHLKICTLECIIFRYKRSTFLMKEQASYYLNEKILIWEVA